MTVKFRMNPLTGKLDMTDKFEGTAELDAGTAEGQVPSWNATGTKYTPDSSIIITRGSGVDTLSFNESYTVVGTEPVGTAYWDDDAQTAVLVLNGGVLLEIGKEFLIRVRNMTGVDIEDGKAVAHAGAVTGKFPHIEKAIATTDSCILGITTEDIADGAYGFVVANGQANFLDTDHLTEGACVYLSDATAGELTSSMPSAENYVIKIGRCDRKSLTEGVVSVSVVSHPKLQDLSGIDGTALTVDGQIAVWDNVNGYFDFNYNIADYSAADAGTAAGQVLFWDATASKWTHTEVGEWVFDDVNKRVGIGTATPSSLLSIYSGTTSATAILESETDHAYLFLDSNAVHNSGIILAEQGSNKWLITNNGSLGSNDLYISNTNFGSEALVILKSNNNVGINTTPARKLEILDATNPQQRWTHTDATVYNELQVDASGDANLYQTGDTLNFLADSSTQEQIAASIERGFIVDTDASRTGYLKLSAIDFNATREGIDIISTGTGVKVEAHGGQIRDITTVNAATYDLLESDYILHCTYTGTGAITSLTLPTAQTVAGRIIHIVDAGGNANTNNIAIDTEGAETINGAATLTLNIDYQSASLYSDGSNWFIF